MPNPKIWKAVNKQRGHTKLLMQHVNFPFLQCLDTVDFSLDWASTGVVSKTGQLIKSQKKYGNIQILAVMVKDTYITAMADHYDQLFSKMGHDSLKTTFSCISKLLTSKVAEVAVHPLVCLQISSNFSHDYSF